MRPEASLRADHALAPACHKSHFFYLVHHGVRYFISDRWFILADVGTQLALRGRYLPGSECSGITMQR
jgi:hypothetical protein